MKPWQFDFEEYIKQGEPEKKEKTYAWKTAIGLQDVDGLEASDYLIETAKDHIEGHIDIKEAKGRIDSYYEAQSVRNESEADTEEADKVSLRIAELLGEKTFNFSPAELLTIHKRLFTDIYSHAGKIRTYNITKKEWVLKGKTVFYASADSIRETLDYDFGQEKKFSYKGLSLIESIKHLAKFTSDIWQIHPFGEGNTRTTAVFIIKYLRTFGFDINNDIFASNSWYFRNAVVRANYNDLGEGVYATTEFLEKFFENLLLNSNNELRNRYLLIGTEDFQSANTQDPKCKNCTLEELAVLNILEEEPRMTQKELTLRIGKSERTVKTITVGLQEKGLLERVNGKRNGMWVVRKN